MNWQNDLADAQNATAVMGVVNGYITVLPRAGIPAAYYPLPVRQPEEVHKWHQLISSAVQSSTNPPVAFQDLSVFFMRASARLHEVTSKPSPANAAGTDMAEVAG